MTKSKKIIKFISQIRLITKPFHKKRSNGEFGWERELFRGTPFYELLKPKRYDKKDKLI